MNRHYESVARRAGHRCEYCRAPESLFNFPFEVEHVVPTARGGTDDEGNLALACRACNAYKSDAITGFDEATGPEVALFHPRDQRWIDHFVADLDSGYVIGLTPVGRATVARLNTNDPVHLTARLFWMRLRLYP